MWSWIFVKIDKNDFMKWKTKWILQKKNDKPILKTRGNIFFSSFSAENVYYCILSVPFFCVFHNFNLIFFFLLFCGLWNVKYNFMLILFYLIYVFEVILEIVFPGIWKVWNKILDDLGKFMSAFSECVIMYVEILFSSISRIRNLQVHKISTLAHLIMKWCEWKKCEKIYFLKQKQLVQQLIK